jgi:hypothetical protein
MMTISSAFKNACDALFLEPIDDDEIEDDIGLGELVDAAQEGAAALKDKAVAFGSSIVGSALVQKGKAVIGENVGMAIGAACPSAAVGFAAATNAASKLVGESEHKSKMVFGIGVLGALTATALTTGLTYLTGAPVECGPALQYMVTAAGTIAGGMTGLQAMDQEVTVDYIPRTAAALATGSVVGGIASAVSSIPIVGTAASLAGAVSSPVLATAAYFAPEIATMADRVLHAEPMPGNNYDPGVFVQTVAGRQGGSKEFSKAVIGQVTQSPLIASVAQIVLKDMIDKKLATNAFVRAFNEYAIILQDETVQEQIEALKKDPSPARQEAVKQTLARLVGEKYSLTEKGIAGTVQLGSSFVLSSLVDQLAAQIEKQEQDCFSFTLSDKAQTQAMLKALLPSLIPLIGVCAKRERAESQDLKPQEIETFYQNMTQALLSSYSNSMLVRGAGKLVSAAIPFMQSHGQFISRLLAATIGDALKVAMAKFPLVDRLLTTIGVKKAFKAVKGLVFKAPANKDDPNLGG